MMTVTKVLVVLDWEGPGSGRLVGLAGLTDEVMLMVGGRLLTLSALLPIAYNAGGGTA